MLKTLSRRSVLEPVLRVVRRKSPLRYNRKRQTLFSPITGQRTADLRPASPSYLNERVPTIQTDPHRYFVGLARAATRHQRPFAAYPRWRFFCCRVTFGVGSPLRVSVLTGKPLERIKVVRVTDAHPPLSGFIPSDAHQNDRCGAQTASAVNAIPHFFFASLLSRRA